VIISENHKNQFYLFDDTFFKKCHSDIFTPHYWHALNAITGEAQGRGTTYFIKHNASELVLRHYYRGGIIGKFVNDTYIFTSLEKTRAFQEFNLLSAMHNFNLPVPTPVACRVSKRGLFYQADLMTSRIENASDLIDILSKKTANKQTWQDIGSTIRRFHDFGIYHHDLNAHNILIDSKDNIWLIDFDRGEKREHNLSWKQGNLQRLLRSFNKEREKIKGFNWQQSDWKSLLEGYKQA